MVNVKMQLRTRMCSALRAVGIPLQDGPGDTYLCRGFGGDQCLVAHVIDTGDHLEFEIRLAPKQIGGNLISGLLIWDALDFWVCSDVRPELNGRIRRLRGDEPLLERTLTYIRNLERSGRAPLRQAGRVIDHE